MLDVQTQENPHSAMCSYWLEGQFHRRVENNVISASAMEAEFVACIEATIQSLWLWNFMTDLQIIIEDIL